MNIRFENFPIVVVTCFQHWPMLELQAQSMKEHLTVPTDIYIIVNEKHPQAWTQIFNLHIRHLYEGHNLTVLYHDDFDFLTAFGKNNKWGGWDDQQILKLAIAERLNSTAYLSLDTQNFLYKKWLYEHFPVLDNKVPYRSGGFVMPMQTWNTYKQALDIEIPDPTNNTMSHCTPIFLHTNLVKDLISSTGGLRNFSKWFHSLPGTKSEYMLYHHWVQKQGGFDKFHHKTDDWAVAYLRDSGTFSNDVTQFLSMIDHDNKFWSWVSINHRAWDDLDSDQLEKVVGKLKQHGLDPNTQRLHKYFN